MQHATQLTPLQQLISFQTQCLEEGVSARDALPLLIARTGSLLRKYPHDPALMEAGKTLTGGSYADYEMAYCACGIATQAREQAVRNLFRFFVDNVAPYEEDGRNG